MPAEKVEDLQEYPPAPNPLVLHACEINLFKFFGNQEDQMWQKDNDDKTRLNDEMPASSANLFHEKLEGDDETRNEEKQRNDAFINNAIVATTGFDVSTCLSTTLGLPWHL